MDIKDLAMVIGAVVVGNAVYQHVVSPLIVKKVSSQASFGLGETDYDPTHEFPVVMGPFGPEYMEGRVVTRPA